MFQTYEEAMVWIHSRRGMGPKPGIKRMEWMMGKMDHPETKFPSIHIAGTNGKGSTVSYLTSLFLAAGQSVGSFTSPHIVKFNERISINGHPITDQEVVDLANQVKPLYEEISMTELGGLTEFEVITSMMFLYFSQTKPDVVLLEVGLGGLFDSTNVAHPDVSMITTIGMDHLQILGGTIESIAFQKAGIIKEGVPVVLGKIDEPAKGVIQDIAQEKHAPVLAYGTDFQAINHPNQIDFNEHFDYQSGAKAYSDLTIKLMGQHQVENAATALHAFCLYCDLQGLTYSEETIRTGLRGAFWPVRMEIMSEEPYVILDGAHNEPAMSVLLQTLQDNFMGKRIKVLYAGLTTKELEKIGQWLAKIPNSEIHLTTFEFPKSATLADLKTRMALENASYHPEWQDALTELIASSNADEMVLVTGSLYFLSDVRKFLLTNKNK